MANGKPLRPNNNAINPCRQRVLGIQLHRSTTEVRYRSARTAEDKGKAWEKPLDTDESLERHPQGSASR